MTIYTVEVLVRGRALYYLKMGVVRSRKSEARSSMTGSWVSSSSNCLVARAEL